MNLESNVAHSAAAGLALVGAACFFAPAVAEASNYLGGTVDFQYYSYGGVYNSLGSPASFVAPGSTSFDTYFTVTVTGNQITYDYLSSVTWSPSATSLNSGGLYVDNGSVIYSVSGVPAITGVRLDPSSLLGSSGFNASDVTWNSGAVAVTWMNQPFAPGNTVILDVSFGPTQTPLPASWTMMLAGLAAFGFVAYRRTKNYAAASAAT